MDGKVVNLGSNTGSAASLTISGQAMANAAAGQAEQTNVQYVDGANVNPFPPEAPIKQKVNLDIPAVYSERFVKILYGFGLKASNENIAILRLMYENGIPLTKENLQKMNHALKLTGSREKALFMFENDMKFTAANSAMLNQIVNKSIKITNLLFDLFNSIASLENSGLKEKLTEILARPKESIEALMPKEVLLQRKEIQEPIEAMNPIPVKPTGVSTAAHLINIAYLENFKSAPEGRIPMHQGNMAFFNDVSKNTPSGEVQSQSVLPQMSQFLNAASKKTVIAPFVHEKPINPPLPNIPGGQVTSTAYETSTNSMVLHAAMPAEKADVLAKTSVQDTRDVHQANNQNNFETQTRASAAIFKNFENILPEAGNNPLEINRFYAALQLRLVEIAALIGVAREQGAGRVLQSVREIANFLEFTAQVRNQIYVQLPIGFGDGVTDMSLFVFKDAKKSSVHDGNGGTSALLCLETANLGLFETFLQKKDKSVTCQFRVKNEQTANLVREHISKLDILFGEHGLSLLGYNFTVTDDTYTIVDKPCKFASQNDGSDLLNGEIPHFDELI